MVAKILLNQTSVYFFDLNLIPSLHTTHWVQVTQTFLFLQHAHLGPA